MTTDKRAKGIKTKRKTSGKRKQADRHSRRRIKRRWIVALTIGLLVIGLYGYVFLTYFVLPWGTRWRALYGEINYPKGYSIHGIDVSHHQGEIKWDRVSRARVDGDPLHFVIIKATEGKSLLDERFNENFYEAREYGLIRGAYHYFAPSVSGKAQAHYYLRQVHLDDGDLPPILDIEESGALTTSQLQKETLDWLDAVEERYGVVPIIYTGLKFKERHLCSPDFDRYPFWIAHYYVDSLRYEGEWRFWQHTDLGHIDGIRGPVDLDIYNGSIYDLRHFVIGNELEPQDYQR